MDLLGFDIPNWLLVALLAFFAYYMYCTWNFGILARMGIKGPKPYPIVGNLGRWFIEGVAQSDLSQVRQYGKLVGIYELRRPALLIADPEMLKHICVKESANFVNRRKIPLRGIFKYSVLDLTDQHFKDVRSLLTPAFSAGKLKQMTKMLRECTDNLVKYIGDDEKNGRASHIKERAGAFTLDAIAATAFGLQTDAQKDPSNPFLVQGKKVLSPTVFNAWIFVFVFLPFLLPLFELLGCSTVPVGVTDFFTKAITELLEERRSSNKPHHVDFMKLLDDAGKNLQDAEEEVQQELAADGLTVDTTRKKKGLTNEEIIAQGFLFFIAGYETTASTLTFFTYNLATHPEIQDKVIQEIDDVIKGGEATYENTSKLTYVQMCIDETLRLYPAVPRMDRRASEAIDIEGVHIPKDFDIILPFYALHRDPSAWPEPDKFDPERFTPENKAQRHPYQFMPFGMGPRSCIGKRLALLELKMAIVAIFQKYKFAPCDETPIPLKLQKAFFLIPEKPIKLKVLPRHD